MPLRKCSESGKPGWMWGHSPSKCWVYKAGDKSSEMNAKKSAIKQGIAENGGKYSTSSFKERGIIAMEIAEGKEELAKLEAEQAAAMKMAPPTKEDRSEPAVMAVPANGYEDVNSESLTTDDCQVNLMEDRVSDNQDYVPSDSE